MTGLRLSMRWTPAATAGSGSGGSASYAPAQTPRTITGTTRYVDTTMTNAAIKAVYDLSVAGDATVFRAGTYDQPAIFTAGFNRSGTIMAEGRGAYDADPMGGSNGPHLARFARTVVFEMGVGLGNTPSLVTAPEVTLNGITFTTPAGFWPADNAAWSSLTGVVGARPAMLQLRSTADDFEMFYCESWIGYGATKLAMDPTVKYADSNSPPTWYYDTAVPSELFITATPTGGASFPGHGDGTYLTYNRLANGPVALGVNNYVGSRIIVYGNYFHDMTGGLKGILSPNGEIVVQHNWMSRITQDFGSYAVNAGADPDRIEFSQNIWEDPLSQAADNGNPHSDSNQVFLAYVPATPDLVSYVRGIASNRNIMWATPNCRGAAQQNYFQMSDGSYGATDSLTYGQGIYARENIAFQTGNMHVLDAGVSRDLYVRGNMGFHPLGALAIATAQVIARNQNGRSATLYSKSLYQDNLYEASPTGGAQFDSTGNAHIGVRSARTIADATIFAGTASGVATLHAMYEATKRTATYANVGPTPTSIKDFLLAPMDWSSEPTHLGWLDVVDGVPTVNSTSSLSIPMGGVAGTAYTLTVPAGVEVQKYATDRTTVLTAWTTAPITVNIDQCMIQLRAAAPTAGTGVDHTITMGASSFVWHVESPAATLYPKVTMTATNIVSQPAVLAAGADSTSTVLAWICDIPSIPAASQTLFGGANTPVLVQLLSTGKWRVTLKTAAGSAIGTINFDTAMTTGALQTILLSIDMTQATAAAGVQLYVNGSSIGVTTSSGWVQNGIIGHSRAVVRYLGHATAAFTGGFSMLYMQPGQLLDLSVSGNRQKFNKGVINSDASNVVGGAPPVFFVGYAAKLNATSPATTNYGTVTFTNAGSTFTATSGNTEVWP